MAMSLTKQHGFTLLELMVVIAIISILAAFSAPTFVRQITKAKLVEVENLATQNQSLVEEYILLNGKFPAEQAFKTLTQPLPAEQAFKTLTQPLPDDSIAKSIRVTNPTKATGNIVITLNDDTGIDAGQTITYTRDKNRQWHCESDLKTSVLPPKCTSIKTSALEGN
ncbi:Fimbrial protein precursor [Marinomonas spartinae]|uniref:pilin n=1 Tax=Marinomonas spartinae TaxID=1792290 RepID=UPI000808EFF5|nr:type II secretion system protein [Marinomonas spartinae]SBS38163.1 Fimbrial protein precursor [Marinomonas spartinae]